MLSLKANIPGRTLKRMGGSRPRAKCVPPAKVVCDFEGWREGAKYIQKNPLKKQIPSDGDESARYTME